eukprot:5993855-Prymnesium_polylepis.1
MANATMLHCMADALAGEPTPLWTCVIDYGLVAYRIDPQTLVWGPKQWEVRFGQNSLHQRGAARLCGHAQGAGEHAAAERGRH